VLSVVVVLCCGVGVSTQKLIDDGVASARANSLSKARSRCFKLFSLNYVYLEASALCDVFSVIGCVARC
jgi:hypothetical protein